MNVANYRVVTGMKIILGMLLWAVSSFAGSSVYDFTPTSIEGQVAPLSNYKGKVMLVVNVASKCGYTPQYSALESLYRKYKEQGLVVLGFPANNFKSQEPGTDGEIKTFCKSKYDVSFPMYSKISVKGDDQAPLYHYLTDQAVNPSINGDVKWNFTKFLIGKNGTVIARFEPATKPDSPEVMSAIEAALKQ